MIFTPFFCVLHVKGLTNLHPSIPKEIRGTYKALAHPVMIAYLKHLGITALELLPVAHFVSEPRLQRLGLSNYWGYNPLAMFALEPRYAVHPDKARDEFRDAVKALHAAARKGYEVLFTPVGKLLGMLQAAKATNSYDRKLSALAKTDLLIIDDFGLKPFKSSEDEDFHDGNNGGKSRAEACAVLRGNEHLTHFAAVATPASMQDEMCHFQLDLRQFNDLMDVVRLHIREGVAATATFAGIKFRDLGWTESLLSEPFAPFPAFSIGYVYFLAFGERIVAGWRLVGIRGIGAELGLEHLNAFPECLNFTVQNMNVPQHRPRGVHHHFGGKTGSYGHCYPHGHPFWALRDISVTIRRGETVGIVGRNGSGKSTLLQLVAGVIRPTEGRLTTSGRIGALLELGSCFNQEFTGRENVRLGASVLGLNPDTIEARIPDIAHFADIGPFFDRPVRLYSSGMQARLAFALVSHVDADILIVDEALAVGDAAFAQKCMGCCCHRSGHCVLGGEVPPSCCIRLFPFF